MQRIVDSIISPGLMANISWTGKSGKKNVDKIKFEVYANITQLICDVCIAADKKMDENAVIHELKYAVIKYAHTRGSVATSTVTGTTTIATTSTAPITQTVATPASIPERNVQSIEFVMVDENGRVLSQQEHQQQPQILHHQQYAPSGSNQFGNLQQMLQAQQIQSAPHRLTQYSPHPHITYPIEQYNAPSWSYDMKL